MAGVIWCSFKVSGDTRVVSMRCEIRTFPSRVYRRACLPREQVRSASRAR